MKKNPNIISRIDWSDHRGAGDYDSIEQKMRKKHGVSREDLEDTFFRDSNPNPVLYDPRGKPGDPELDSEIGYFMGKMEHGDYLVMVVISCGSEDGIVLSARRMNDREKRTYQNNISRMRRLI